MPHTQSEVLHGNLNMHMFISILHLFLLLLLTTPCWIWFLIYASSYLGFLNHVSCIALCPLDIDCSQAVSYQISASCNACNNRICLLNYPLRATLVKIFSTFFNRLNHFFTHFCCTHLNHFSVKAFSFVLYFCISSVCRHKYDVTVYLV